MPEKIELDLVANTGEAKRNVEELKSSIEELNKEKEKSNDLDKESTEVTANQSKIIRLFDQATGGAVTRVKSFIEGIKALIVEVKGLTVAQIKANAAILANPYIAVGAAVTAFVGSLGFLVKKSYDEGVPALTTLKNVVLSFGNAARFAKLQAEALANDSKFITDRQIEQTERAIAVLQAFGENTTQIEIENQERRLSLLKKGTDEYRAEETKLLVLRAKAAREQGEKEEKSREEGRQAKLKEIQEQEALDADIRASNTAQDEFDKGYLEEEAYLAGKRAVYGDLPEDDPYFSFLDPNKDPELDPELQYSLALNDALIKVEKDKAEKIKAARQDLFLNLVSIFGAETKLGKAFLVAKQVETAALLVQEIRKNITFSKASAERTTIAAAEAIATSNLAVAQGAAETAKLGFPKNIPLLIAYAAQAAGIIGAVRQAVRGIPTAQAAFVPAAPGVSPQIVQTIPNVSPVGRDQASQLADVINNQQQRPVRAYVVSTDVSSAQQLDRNIVEGASI
jgi:hypothetical protein